MLAIVGTLCMNGRHIVLIGHRAVSEAMRLRRHYFIGGHEGRAGRAGHEERTTFAAIAAAGAMSSKRRGEAADICGR